VIKSGADDLLEDEAGKEDEDDEGILAGPSARDSIVDFVPASQAQTSTARHIDDEAMIMTDDHES